MSMPTQEETDQPAISFRVGDLLVETGRQRVSRDGVALSLPKLSYDLLLVLIRASPNLVSNDELLEKVWPKAVVSPETLSQRIKLLRDALGDNPRSPTYVEGLRGRGYRLIPPVTRASGAMATVGAPTVAVPAEQGFAEGPAMPASAAADTAAETAMGLRWGIRRHTSIALALLGVVAVLVGVYLYRGHANVPKTEVEVVAVQPRAVAVLPFATLSDAPGSQYIALGIAESVLNRLGSVRELIVIARSSSFSLGSAHPDVREVARKLGVQYVVEGSVQRVGSQLRVNAQLVDAVLNREMWSLSLDRNVDDVFAMQDEIALRVSEKLAVSLSKARPEYAAFGTEAYLALLHGRTLMESRKIPDLEAAIAEFSRALKLAPAFAAAMVDLVRAKLSLYSVRGDFSKIQDAVLPEMRAMADRAIELDPGSGPAYFLRAQLKHDSSQDQADAEADFRKGMELAPNDAYGIYNYGGFLYEQSRFDEALALVDRASLVDPMAASTHYLRGQILYVGFARMEEAAASYRQALAITPDFYPALTRLSMVLFQTGKLAESIQLSEKAVAVEPNAGWSRSRLLWLYVHLGDLEAARDVQRGFDPSDSNGRLNTSMICYRAGNLEGADRIVRRGIKDPDIDGGLSWMLGFEVLIERALAHHETEATRQFIMSIPTLKKNQGRLAVSDENWPSFVSLAAMEKQSGNLDEARRMSLETLEFVQSGGLHGPRGMDDWTRASALAVLGREEEAMQALETMARNGSYWRWWATLESDPSFAAMRSTPRFKRFDKQTREYMAGQQALVRGMIERGELISRHSTAPVDGC